MTKTTAVQKIDGVPVCAMQVDYVNTPALDVCSAIPAVFMEL